MMHLRIGIPVLNRGDLLLRLVRSIDVDAEVLVIVNRIGPVDPSVLKTIDTLRNSPPGRARVVFREIEGNLGVAGSWNTIVDAFRGNCMIANSDIEFVPGTLAQALSEIDRRSEVLMHHLCAAACFHVSENFTRDFGWFDENFYPAYCEDQEMALRAGQLEIRRVNVKAAQREVVKHDGSQTLKSASSETRRYVHAAKQLGAQYLLKRWGPIAQAVKNRPVKQFPFNDSSLHPADWKLDMEMRSRIASLCHGITGYHCPIIYHRKLGGLGHS